MRPILRKRFGIRVRELRKQAGFSQEAFADRCGFARTYMSRIETGGSNVSLDAIETLASALNITVETLFKGL
ncbi:helix-turn-helix domain-containing protein [Oxalobacter aliiformigenes]|uniref:helix-turn-helix domain-containing protein n=1 Tax=Oxalobacter aliiformigenes TaxID=2946593 RepID=UPI0022AF4C4D|nr:helix-turn-helix transcriptional regulator [Oxalobacter aliiformigenes]MCZ4064375.1 helix-turn-helix domain-containing protein [Oxalobacter aliiformigenes]WAV99726.1 helix-turn-helix domain-containing protein [Oxalobacter aliiformigenes]